MYFVFFLICKWYKWPYSPNPYFLWCSWPDHVLTKQLRPPWESWRVRRFAVLSAAGLEQCGELHAGQCSPTIPYLWRFDRIWLVLPRRSIRIRFLRGESSLPRLTWILLLSPNLRRRPTQVGVNVVGNDWLQVRSKGRIERISCSMRESNVTPPPHAAKFPLRLFWANTHFVFWYILFISAPSKLILSVPTWVFERKQKQNLIAQKRNTWKHTET